MRVGSSTPTTVLVLFLMAETTVTTLSPLTQKNLPFHIDRQGVREEMDVLVTASLFTIRV